MSLKSGHVGNRIIYSFLFFCFFLQNKHGFVERRKNRFLFFFCGRPMEKIRDATDFIERLNSECAKNDDNVDLLLRFQENLAKGINLCIINDVNNIEDVICLNFSSTKEKYQFNLKKIGFLENMHFANVSRFQGHSLFLFYSFELLFINLDVNTFHKIAMLLKMWSNRYQI